MLRSIVLFVAAACAATGVDAQESRLDAILRELGYDVAEIARLHADGAV